MGFSVLKVSFLSWRLCLVLMVMLWSSHACFIRNCPRGGKRSMGSMETSRQCMSCGPRGVGQCVGPSICCGPDIGCLMGTPEAEVCQKENESTTPCSVSGHQCGVNNMGNCVADGICCDEDACSYNSLCKDSESETETTRQELLSLVRRLLVNRQYD
ncbi:terepressin/terephysin-like [Littorina saxatilis]|uniref:Conopressin/neurophysin n=1 Tax=Littorina saxatilis TaxID=31220 RepID=A0AAN9GI31_9CAEN